MHYRESKLWGLPEVQREQAMELTHSIERASYGANQK